MKRFLKRLTPFMDGDPPGGGGGPAPAPSPAPEPNKAGGDDAAWKAKMEKELSELKKLSAGAGAQGNTTAQQIPAPAPAEPKKPEETTQPKSKSLGAKFLEWLG